jgi:hypothetical protein
MELNTIGKLSDNEREQLRKTGDCFHCRKPGHLARDCSMNNHPNPKIYAIDTPDLDTEESGKD